MNGMVLPENGMRELALFAGAGGGILGGMLHEWRTVAAVEIEDYPRRVLLQRQADGILPRFPIWDDVCTFDGKPWRGKVDIVTGGFPCQDISSAGKGAGIEGERSGLWKEMARIIGEVRPTYAFMENSPLLISRGLAVVLGDLAKMGYDARWGVFGGGQFCNSPILRERIFILGSSDKVRGGKKSALVKQDFKWGNTDDTGSTSKDDCKWNDKTADGNRCHIRGPWKTCAGILAMVDGVDHRLDEIKAIGNGQIPAVAALAWEVLSK